ncbi:MAG: hypothetical protein WBG86_14510 [Polyangiales bacterium]
MGFPMRGDNFEVVSVPLAEYERVTGKLDEVVSTIGELMKSIDEKPLQTAIALLRIREES